jgi:hypothetical protein
MRFGEHSLAVAGAYLKHYLVCCRLFAKQVRAFFEEHGDVLHKHRSRRATLD